MSPLPAARPTFAAVATLVLFAAAAGCRSRSLNGALWHGPTDARSPVADAAPEVDLGAWAGGPPDAVGTDVVVADAAPPPSALRVFENVVLAEEALRRARWVECFGASPTVIAGWTLVDSVGDGRAAAALSAGRAVVDSAKADACLATIARATCPEIAAGATDLVCVDLLAGKVPPNGACRADFECAGAQGAYRCEGDVRAACGGRCTPRPRSGEACGDVECALGTTCQRVDGGVEQCLKVSLTGAPCKTADGCGVNDYCRWRTPYDRLEGTCQPRASGALCEGGWECPFLYTCVAAAGDGAGHCQVGLPVGANCRVYGRDAINGPYDDCAISLSCLPGADGAWRCSEGAATGEACGTLWSNGGATSTSIPCRDGGCVYASQSDSLGTCRPFAPLGGRCAGDEECGPRRACVSGACVAAVPSSFPVGARCPLGICASGARCQPTGGPTAESVCVAPTPDGQPCRGDAMCANLSRCQGGVCTPCP